MSDAVDLGKVLNEAYVLVEKIDGKANIATNLVPSKEFDVMNADQTSSPAPVLLSDSGKPINTDEDIFGDLTSAIDDSNLSNGSDLRISMESFLLNGSHLSDWTSNDVSTELKELLSDPGKTITKQDDKIESSPSDSSKEGKNSSDEITQTESDASKGSRCDDEIEKTSLSSESEKEDLRKIDYHRNNIPNGTKNDVGEDASQVLKEDMKISGNNIKAPTLTSEQSQIEESCENDDPADTNSILSEKEKEGFGNIDNDRAAISNERKKQISEDTSHDSEANTNSTDINKLKATNLTSSQDELINDEAHNSENPAEVNDSGDENSDDSDYVPSEYAVGGENGDSSDEQTEANATPRTVNSSCNSSAYSLRTSFNVPGNSGCDETNQMTELSHGAKGGQKKNFCFYCKKLQSKIARHLESRHADEEEVKKFCSLPKKNAERGKIIAKIRKKGNFLFNVNEEFNNGKLITVRRPTKNENRSGQHFIVCPKCRGFYTKNNIRHHHRTCSNKKNTARNVLAKDRKTLGRIHECASLVLRRDVFPIMRDDNITRIIKYDKLVMLYGNKLCKKLRLAHQHDEIRAHLRRMGRFLEAIKQVDPSITKMADVYDPKHYDAAVDAVNIVAQLDPKTHLYKVPSLAAALGTALKKIGLIMETECIKDHNDAGKKNTKNFLKLLEEDYTYSVNKGVSETMMNVQRTKTVNLPKTDDIRVLDNHLNEIIDNESANLKQTFDYESWKNLAEATLIKLQVFNRRRAGELERLSIEEFKNRKSIDENDELYQNLTEHDKISAKKYVRIEIRGKLNRTVPVLMSAKMLQDVELILKYRKAAGVSSENRHIFGIKGGDGSRYLRACMLMRKFSENCGAKNPLSLRGTNLRKHIATRCVDMNLSDNQITRVANFMGHHENIHRSIYRQPVVRLDIIDMSKVLKKAQGLNVSDPSQLNSTTMNSTDDNHGEADSTQHNSTIDGSNVARSTPGTSLLETSPAGKKRVRSDSEDSQPVMLESLELAKISKSQVRKKPRMNSTPTQDFSPLMSTRKSTTGRKLVKTSCSTPALSPVATIVTPERVTRRSAETCSENIPPKPTKKHMEKRDEISSASSPSSSDTSIEKVKSKSTKKKVTAQSPKNCPSTSIARKPRWNKKEIQEAVECFNSYLEADKLPSLKVIENEKKNRNYLQNRTTAVIKTWLSNQLRVVRNGGTLPFATATVSKSVLRHVAFIFENYIADGKLPSVKQCEEARKNDRKLQNLSAAQIRNLVKDQI